ncbi:MAG: YfhO family protein [Candidatus Hydrogenedentes bacterium]|nr:YfhO family protein [Candidatus Hydrogenedentota bacterium]
MIAELSGNLKLTFLETDSPYRYSFRPMLLVALVFVALAPIYWNAAFIAPGGPHEAYENSDLYQFYYPAYDFAFGSMQKGHFPMWNSRQLCGTPVYTDARLGLFQPLNAVFLIAPLEQAMALHGFLCLFLMGLFFVLAARATGVGHLPALLGGIVYAFCGFAAGGVTRPPVADALVWLPLFFWAVREFAYHFDRAMAVLAGVIGALLILSGVYALAVAAALLAVPYLALIAVFPHNPLAPPFLTRVKLTLSIPAVALGVSAVQWLPSLNYALATADPSQTLWNMTVAAQPYTAPGELLAQVFAPTGGMLPRLGYVGIPALALIPAALFHRHRWREVGFFFGATAVLIAVATLLPIRLPLSFPRLALLHPAIFGIAMLVSLGADRVLVPKQNFRAPSIFFPAVAMMAVIVFVAVGFGGEVRGKMLAMFMIVGPFLIWRKHWLRNVTILALAVLLFVDLTSAGKTQYRHPRQNAPGCYTLHATVLDTARVQAAGARAFFSTRDLDVSLNGNLGFIYPLSLIGGVDLPVTKDEAQWWERLVPNPTPLTRTSGNGVSPDAAQPGLLRFMAARVLLATPQGLLREPIFRTRGARLRELPASGEDVRIFLNEDALPRSYWTPRWRVAVGLTAALDALADPSLDPARECVVDAFSDGLELLAADSASAKVPDEGVSATCSVEDVSPEHVIVRVESTQPGITVLADTFSAGWVAWVDGERQPILKVNGLFRGVATRAGEHVIEFRYRPLPHYVGLAVSFLSLAATGLLGLRFLFLRR